MKPRLPWVYCAHKGCPERKQAKHGWRCDSHWIAATIAAPQPTREKQIARNDQAVRARREAEERAKGQDPYSDISRDACEAQIFELIDAAAPFMDEGSDPSRWEPSEKLKVRFLAAATRGGEGWKVAYHAIIDALERHRERWTKGLNPDPFAPEAPE